MGEDEMDEESAEMNELGDRVSNLFGLEEEEEDTGNTFLLKTDTSSHKKYD